MFAKDRLQFLRILRQPLLLLQILVKQRQRVVAQINHRHFAPGGARCIRRKSHQLLVIGSSSGAAREGKNFGRAHAPMHTVIRHNRQPRMLFTHCQAPLF